MQLGPEVIPSSPQVADDGINSLFNPGIPFASPSVSISRQQGGEPFLLVAAAGSGTTPCSLGFIPLPSFGGEGYAFTCRPLFFPPASFGEPAFEFPHPPQFLPSFFPGLSPATKSWLSGPHVPPFGPGTDDQFTAGFSSTFLERLFFAFFSV